MTTKDTILKLLPESMSQQGMNQQAWLAKQLGLSKDAVSKALRELQKEGKVERFGGKTTGGYYELSFHKSGSEAGRKLHQYEKGSEATSIQNLQASDQVRARSLQERSEAINETPTIVMEDTSKLQPKAKLQLRLHRLQRNFKLTSPLDTSKLAPLKQVQIDNMTYWHSAFAGTSFKITNNILEIEGIEIWSDRRTPVAMTEGLAYFLAENMARAIAKQYGLSIDYASASSPKGLMEVELTEHEMAERVKKKGKIPLHWDENLNADVWMDKSFGLGGLESNVVAYIQRLTDFTNYIVEEKWSVKEQLEFNKQTQDFQRQEQQFFTSHNEMIKEITQGQRTLNALMMPIYKVMRFLHIAEKLKEGDEDRSVPIR